MRATETAWAVFVTTSVVIATVQPVCGGRNRDSFPLSNYPMFARKKTSPSIDMHYFVAPGRDGKRRYVAPSLVVNGEVLQARATIQQVVSRGAEARRSFCAKVAERLAAASGWEGLELHLVRGRHDSVQILTGADPRAGETILTRCPIRPAEPGT